jgi:hypothetical protein
MAQTRDSKIISFGSVNNPNVTNVKTPAMKYAPLAKIKFLSKLVVLLTLSSLSVNLRKITQNQTKNDAPTIPNTVNCVIMPLSPVPTLI